MVCRIYRNCVLLALLCILTGRARADNGQLPEASLRTGVLPEPQITLALPDDKPFRLDADVHLVVPDPADRPGVELLLKDIKHRFGLEWTLAGDVPGATGVSCVIIDRAKPGSGHGPFASFGETRPEGYRLAVQENRIVIEGHDDAGTFYGIQTLRQLIRHDRTVPALAILDWPEMPWRIAYGSFGGRVATTVELIDLYLESAAMAKMNVVILETLWNHHQNWWFNPTDDRLRLGRYFFKRARELHIEPVPLVQGPGWGYGVTDLAPMLSEGVWIADENVTLTSAAPTALKQTNVVTNEHAPIVVTSEDGTIRYVQDRDFKVIPGVTVRPYQASHAPWRLQAIAGGRIADGQTVLVSYNHVTPHGHKAYSLADPGTYAILDRTIDNVMTLYKPRMIHIGHDEIWDLGKDSRAINSGLEPAELVLRHLLHVYGRIRSHNPEAVILVWDDLFRHERSGVSNGILHNLADRIPKDLILCPWIYHATDAHYGSMQNRLRQQTEMGFRVIGAGSGYWMQNNALWYRALRPYVETGQARGMMFTEWEAALNGSSLPAAAELMWSGQRVHQPVFDQMAAITARLKTQGMALTYPLTSVRQRDAFVAFFKAVTDAGGSPSKAVADFRRDVIGDTTVFEQAYGRENWDAMGRSAVIHVQQAAMVQCIPAYLEAMAWYMEAEEQRRRGDEQQARASLVKVIDRLHELGLLSRDATRGFRETAWDWIPFDALFG